MVASKAMTMAGLGSMVLGVVLIIVLYGIVPTFPPAQISGRPLAAS
jgi:drug/metabolite transporter superfamily protein YnfA